MVAILECQTAKHQGPVVQSIISLTSSLRGQLLSVLQLYNQICWNFLLKKWEKSFSHFFNKKYWCNSDINIWNFNETLTNDVVSFEHRAQNGLMQTSLWHKPKTINQHTKLGAFS